MMYVALIGDMVGSRSFAPADREEIQGRLRAVMAAANGDERYQADVEAGFVITTGDEFQGLLRDGADALRFARFVQDFMGEEARFRFGVGRGTLATREIPEKALGIDGPCFHNARDAIVRAKRDDAACSVAGFGVWDGILNVLMDNFYTPYGGLTAKQRKIYNLRYLHGYDVPRIQNALEYNTPRYVYKVLEKREVEVMRETEGIIGEVFTTRVLAGREG
jgi:hypothetical protein